MAYDREAPEAVEEGKDATEGTSLLGVLPSPNSTEQPSSANLPAANGSSTGYGSETAPLVELSSLPPPTSNIRNFLFNSKIGDDGLKHSSKTWACRLGWSGIVALVVLALVLIDVSLKRHQANSEANQHHFDHHPTSFMAVPFSVMDPVQDLGLYEYMRDKDTSPPPMFIQNDLKTYPTNAWYQNMLLAREEPIMAHRAYTVPYVLDAVGPIPGLNVHPNRVTANTNLVQLTFVDSHALTLGADREIKSKTSKDFLSKNTNDLTHSYSVLNTKALAVTLEWNAFPMKSTIVRGMPYATMTYDTVRKTDENGQVLLPTLGTDDVLRINPIIDGRNTNLNCSLSNNKKMLVQRDVEISFKESDFTWMIFFSQPVWLQCGKGSSSSTRTAIQVAGIDDTDDTKNAVPLTVRIALLDFCTTGLNPIYCRDREPRTEVDKFRRILRRNADIYPGENADIEFDVQDKKDTATLTFNWDARSMKSTDTQAITSRGLDPNDSDLIMYALPHHMDKFNYSLVPAREQHFVQSLTGTAALLKGGTWTFEEDLLITSFRAPRPPTPESLPAIASALVKDITFQPPDYYLQGIGDTYFSGKMLAKLGRILIVAEELKSLCMAPTLAYKSACAESTLPSTVSVNAALEILRSGTEIWFNGTGATPFVYDTGWGGVCSCGCAFDHGKCLNIFPDCPAFADPGLDFGNGFYNDMHYHYGYMIYAAAIVAHFDPAWGRTHFEQVLLLVRNIANPSDNDVHFPKFRHKDWYQGSSWASGVAIPPNLNGKNQESSSEAIAGYEAVALFGTAMISAWQEVKADDKVVAAKQVREVGRLLAATEVRSARRYWHVRVEESARVYPAEYTHKVVGMLWSTSVQFQTWFGLKPFLAMGIQLLPLTPISEDRDGIDWAKEMYQPFADSCYGDTMCADFGWSILQLAMLATVGHPELAASKALQLSPDAFDSAGGNGHSLTNTLWYIATRPNVTLPIPVPKSDQAPEVNGTASGGGEEVLDCGAPATCTDEALNTIASTFTCRERIVWLMQAMKKSQQDACTQIASVDFPRECGPCNPTPAQKSKAEEEAAKRCPACTVDECNSQLLNRCPSFLNTFVCTQGPSTGGCLGAPWELNGYDCKACCEMTSCQVRAPPEGAKVPVTASPDCPPCTPDVCHSRMNMCPVNTAPWLCTGGAGTGGCSPTPWKLGRDCAVCCEVTPDCHH